MLSFVMYTYILLSVFIAALVAAPQTPITDFLVDATIILVVLFMLAFPIVVIYLAISLDVNDDLEEMRKPADAAHAAASSTPLPPAPAQVA